MNNKYGWFFSTEGLAAEQAKLDFAVAVESALEREDVSRSELANRIGKSPAWVTKVLRGDANVTIETMSELAEALDSCLYIKIAKKDSTLRWFEVVTGGRGHSAANEAVAARVHKALSAMSYGPSEHFRLNPDPINNGNEIPAAA